MGVVSYDGIMNLLIKKICDETFFIIIIYTNVCSNCFLVTADFHFIKCLDHCPKNVSNLGWNCFRLILSEKSFAMKPKPGFLFITAGLVSIGAFNCLHNA